MQHANANRVTTVDFVIETSLSTADAVDNRLPKQPDMQYPTPAETDQLPLLGGRRAEQVGQSSIYVALLIRN